jgi:hypothetical protein
MKKCAFGKVEREVIEVGPFTEPIRIDPPVSPIDGYQYSRDECDFSPVSFSFGADVSSSWKVQISLKFMLRCECKRRKQ